MGELELNLAGHEEVVAAKALVAQFDVRLHNPAYVYLSVADFRRRESPIVCPNEVDKVVEREKCLHGAFPLIVGAHIHFGLAKKRFFLIPEEERHKTAGLVCALFVDKSLPLPLYFCSCRCPLLPLFM